MSEKRCYGCMKLKTQSPVCEHCGYDERMGNASHQLPVGTMLMGRYRIGKVLGQGGFGITYIGWDTFLETAVAVKEYYPSGVVMRDNSYSLNVSSGGGEMDTRFQNNRERFLREAKALARFDSVPQVVQVSNYFLDNNTAYIVMEFVEGITLKQHVKKNGGKLSAEQTLALLGPVMLALDKVHATGLIHRDISPDNIMLLPNGGVKLIDFGAVRDVQHADAENPLTKSTEAILKQGYAPIEQYQKRGSLGPWTDVYALCATIYYCLMGQVPPDAPERLMGEAEFSWDGVPGLEDHQREALEHAMAQLPKDRTQSVKTLHKELFEEPAPKPAPKAPKKKRSLRNLAIVALAAMALVLGGLLFANRPGAEESAKESTKESTKESADDSWRDNVMTNDYDDTFYPGLSVKDIVSVTFLDSTSEAPGDCVDVSAGKNGTVVAWTEENGDYYDLYIAGDGGVNGNLATGWMFSGWMNLKKITFGGNFHTENAANLSGMFNNCYELEAVDIQSLDTSSATNMAGMFLSCESIQSLDLSGFDTSGVTDMSNMFSQCKSLTNLDLSSFDTAQVTNMNAMFSDCASLTDLDLSSFDTANVTNMALMFCYCSNLTALDLSGFDTANVTTMQSMFDYCYNLKKLDVSSFNTSNVENMQQMFWECFRLTGLDLSGFDTSRVKFYTSFMSSGQKVNGCPWEELFATREGENTMVLDEDGFILMDGSAEETKELCVLSYQVSNGQTFTEIGCEEYHDRSGVNLYYTWADNDRITCTAAMSFGQDPFTEDEARDMAERYYRQADMSWNDGTLETESSTGWTGLDMDAPYYALLLHFDADNELIAYTNVKIGYPGVG